MARCIRSLATGVAPGAVIEYNEAMRYPKNTPPSIAQALSAAFWELQIDRHVCLTEWGRRNPTEFYKLVAKLLPAELKLQIENTDGDIIDITPEEVRDGVDIAAKLLKKL